MESRRYRFYAVRMGRIPGIYSNWLDCKRQVNGFKDCEFKGFVDADAALSWLQAGGVFLAPPPSSPPTLPSPPQLGLIGNASTVGESSLSTQLHTMKVGSSDGTRVEADSGRSPNKSSLKGHAIVGDRVGADFVITEDMEVYLIRVCSQLRVEYPVFTRRESYSQNGEQQHGFWVVLQSPQHGFNWVVHGGFSEDEAKARQDAAFQMLEKVLTMTGKAICDYNFKKVCDLQQRVEDLERQVSTLPYHQFRELQEENRRLRSELEMFHEMFEE